MPSTSFFLQLAQKFTEDACKSIINGLRQDNLIWNCFNDQTFSDKIIAIADHVDQWNPGFLAAAAIAPEISENEVDLIRSKPLDPDLRQKAIIHFEQALLSERQPSSLEEAAWIALALKERRRLKGSWLGIREELSMKSPETSISLFDIWATPIACVYSMSNDSLDFLKALLPPKNASDSSDFIRLCMHAILSCPLTPESQVDRIVTLINDLPPDTQLKFLDQLTDWRRMELVERTASSLLRGDSLSSYFLDLNLDGVEDFSHSFNGEKKIEDPLLAKSSLQPIEKLQQLSSFYRYAGQVNRAMDALTSARDANRRLEARLVSQIAMIADANQDYFHSIKSWDHASRLAPDSMIAKVKLASSKIAANQYSSQQDDFPEQDSSNIGKIARIKIALLAGDREKAVSYARQLVDQIVKTKNGQNGIDSLPHPAELLHMLLELNMVKEAVNLAQNLITQFSIDPRSLKLVMKTYLQARKYDDAVKTGLMASMSFPAEIELHRLLSTAFEHSGNLAKALEERQYIIDGSENPQVEDLLALAAIALKTDQIEKCVATAKSILESDPDNGQAHNLLGKAALNQKDGTTAIKHFNQATMLIPECVEPWMGLYRTYEASGELKKASKPYVWHHKQFRNRPRSSLRWVNQV